MLVRDDGRAVLLHVAAVDARGLAEERHERARVLLRHDALPTDDVAPLGAIALLVTAVVSLWRVKEPGRVPLLCCAMLSIVVNAAAGLLKPASGTVNIFGEPLAGLNRQAGYLFQQDSLMPWKTSIENVASGS